MVQMQPMRPSARRPRRQRSEPILKAPSAQPGASSLFRQNRRRQAPGRTDADRRLAGVREADYCETKRGLKRMYTCWF